MKFFDFFKIVFDATFIVQLLAVSFSIVWIFYEWKREKKNILIGVSRMIGLFTAGTVLNWLLFALSRVLSAIAGLHFYIAWLCMILIYLGIFDKTFIVSRLIMGLTLFITVCVTIDLGREAMMCFQKLNENGHFDYFCFISYLLMVLFSLVIKNFSLKNYDDIPIVSVVLIIINTVVSTILVVLKTVIKIRSRIDADAYYCAVLMAIYIVSITGYMMIYFHCKVHKEKTELEVQNKLLEADKQMLIVSGQAIEEMRALRHDIKNQQKIMSLMLEENRYDDLKVYFDSVSEEIKYKCLSEFINCGNRFVNSVINMEILKATSYGVKLITQINVPETLPFEQSDFCRVLVNLIDNAIEGIMRTKNREYVVDVKIGSKNDYLYICVQNKICEDADINTLLRMNTVKDDAANHGYGHKIVKRIVEKYNGYVNYTVEKNEFIAEVMLDKRGLI